MTTSNSNLVDQLPTTIRGFLTAHVARDVDAALHLFTPTAVVVDNDTTYRGTEEIRDFVATAGAEFTYTVTLLAVEHTDDAHWVTTHRVEGDFPGGVVDLRYRFVIDGDLVRELVIAP